MPQNPYVVVDQFASDELISFLQAIPDGRYRRGCANRSASLLLVAALGILSGCLPDFVRSRGDRQAALRGAEPGARPGLPAVALRYELPVHVQ